MKSSLIAFAFSGMVAIATAGCGSGSSDDDGGLGGLGGGGAGGTGTIQPGVSDIVNQVCNRYATCKKEEGSILSASEMDACKQEGSAISGLSSTRQAQVISELSQCVKMICSSFESCVEAVDIESGGTGGTGGTGGISDAGTVMNQLCDKVATCARAAGETVTASEIAECKQEGEVELASLSANEKSRVVSTLGPCVDVDCASLETCIDQY